MKRSNDTKHFHELLSDIVQEFGNGILADPKLNGIISDLADGSDVVKFRSVIRRSVSDHIGQRILQFMDLDEADFSLRINTLKQSFQEENFFRHGISDYIVDSYLFALGRINRLDGYEEDASVADGMAKPGEFSFVERSGEEYCGNISKENERSGFGISKMDDGSYFAGEWKLDMRNGIGIHCGNERYKYAGEWRFNRKAGAGIEITSEGNRYAGEWKNGKKNGHGMICYVNGESMCTIFRDDRPWEDAIGIYYLKDGSCVIGCMLSDGPNGKCFHCLLDGSCVEEL